MAVPTHIVDRMLTPERGTLSAEHARYVLELDFTEQERDRCEDLSYKAQEGGLSAEEREELEWYFLANTFLTVMHSKARRSLDDARPTAA